MHEKVVSFDDSILNEGMNGVVSGISRCTMVELFELWLLNEKTIFNVDQ